MKNEELRKRRSQTLCGLTKETPHTSFLILDDAEEFLILGVTQVKGKWNLAE